MMSISLNSACQPGFPLKYAVTKQETLVTASGCNLKRVHLENSIAGITIFHILDTLIT